MLAAKEDIKVVSQVMGHARTSITHDIYQDVIPALKQGAAEKLEALLANV